VWSREQGRLGTTPQRAEEALQLIMQGRGATGLFEEVCVAHLDESGTVQPRDPAAHA
jgi:hypothetical protein